MPKNLLNDEELKQLVLDKPLHVPVPIHGLDHKRLAAGEAVAGSRVEPQRCIPQSAWHGMHTPELFAYLPTGVQDARQLPSPEPR